MRTWSSHAPNTSARSRSATHERGHGRRDRHAQHLLVAEVAIRDRAHRARRAAAAAPRPTARAACPAARRVLTSGVPSLARSTTSAGEAPTAARRRGLDGAQVDDAYERADELVAQRQHRHRDRPSSASPARRPSAAAPRRRPSQRRRRPRRRQLGGGRASARCLPLRVRCCRAA